MQDAVFRGMQCCAGTHRSRESHLLFAVHPVPGPRAASEDQERNALRYAFIKLQPGLVPRRAFRKTPSAEPPTATPGLLRPAVPLVQRDRESTDMPGLRRVRRRLGADARRLSVSQRRSPSGSRDEKLPVLVWIYGGGFDAGSVADQRYNMTYMVSNSVEIDKPILAVAINYRVGGWGFLASQEVLADDAANIGLWDQRMALEWIKENIASFGGDPDKITIWGESAGAFSVGYHLLANGGDSEGLFRAAIMDSGTALGSQMQDAAQIASEGGYQELFDNVTATVGCSNASDKMDCLRLVPYERLFNAFEPQVYNPIIDGAFLDRLPSESFACGRVAEVSLLLGANTDEGTATFWGPRGTLNTTADVVAWIKTLNSTNLTLKEMSDLLELYPDDPAQGCPFGTGEQRFASQGWMYKRGAAIATDKSVHAGRRGTAQFFAGRRGCKVWSYRFDQAPWNGLMELIATTPPVYATHYSELGFVFKNPDNSLSNWIGPGKTYHDLSAAMSKAWISFVHDLDPNIPSNTEIPSWPEYQKTERNMVLRTKESGGSYIEEDDYRQAQIAWWNDHWKIFGT